MDLGVLYAATFSIPSGKLLLNSLFFRAEFHAQGKRVTSELLSIQLKYLS
jgi:hypothetical protein